MSLRLARFGTAVTLASASFAAEKHETVALFDSRKVAIAIPEGFEFAIDRPLEGLATVHLNDRREKLSLTIRFLPSTDELAASARSRREFMVGAFRQYVDGSVEKGMEFEELEPKFGAGTYSVLTDANLVGKSPLPPGDFRHVTAGVKTWPGVVAIFSLFSDDTTSPQYQAVFRMLRESVRENPVPLK